MITIKPVSPFTVRMLVALFRRAVELNASLVNINADRQSRFRAGNKTANNVIAAQRHVLEFLSKRDQQQLTATEIAREIEAADAVEDAFEICEHLSSHPNCNVKKLLAQSPIAAKYCFA